MDKPAQVILQFDKTTQGFWSGFVEVVDKKTVREVGDTVIALIPVRTYNLSDHQFVQIKVTMGGGNELVVLISRGIVMGIVEGKVDLGKTGFFPGSAKKSALSVGQVRTVRAGDYEASAEQTNPVCYPVAGCFWLTSNLAAIRSHGGSTSVVPRFSRWTGRPIGASSTLFFIPNCRMASKVGLSTESAQEKFSPRVLRSSLQRKAIR